MPVKKLPLKTFLPYIAITVTTLIWGAAGPIIKYTLSFVPPLTFLFIRFLVACVILLPFTFLELRRNKISKKDYFNFFLFGVFSQASIALIFVGLKYTSVLDSMIIGIMGSIMSVYAGHYFYKEKVDSKIRVGLAVSSIGTLLVVLEPIITDGEKTLILHRIFGNILIMTYNLCWVLFVVWSKMSMGERSNLLKKTLSFIHLKPMSKKYSPNLITYISMYVGLIVLTPLALLENTGVFGYLTYFDIFNINPKGVVGILYLAIFSSIVAYSCYQWALEHIKVRDAAFFGYLSPLFTIPVAYLLLGEIPNIYMIIGAILIAIGVFIAENKK